MIDPAKFVVISNKNWRTYAAEYQGGAFPNDSLVPLLREGSRGYLGWQCPEKPIEFKGPKPVAQIIPRSEWPDRIRAGQGSRIYDLMVQAGVKSKDQDGRNWCWGFGSVRAVEAKRLALGFPHVELSPESVCGPATNWRNVGGYASEAFDQMQQYGMCEMSYVDTPCSMSPSRWKTGWQENALTHRVVDWYNLDTSDSNGMYEEVVTCLLNDCPLGAGLGYWGHLVAFIGVALLPDNTVGVLMQNSWLQGNWPRQGDNGFAILTEGRATPDGAAAPIVMIDAPTPTPVPVPDPTPTPIPDPGPGPAPSPPPPTPVNPCPWLKPALTEATRAGNLRETLDSVQEAADEVRILAANVNRIIGPFVPK